MTNSECSPFHFPFHRLNEILQFLNGHVVYLPLSFTKALNLENTVVTIITFQYVCCSNLC